MEEADDGRTRRIVRGVVACLDSPPADDDSIKAIVLRVDSPGGSVYPSDLIWRALEEAKKKKRKLQLQKPPPANDDKAGAYYDAMLAAKGAPLWAELDALTAKYADRSA